MRKNVRATEIIAWCTDQLAAAVKETVQPNQTMQRINQLNGRIEALLDINDMIYARLREETDEE